MLERHVSGARRLALVLALVAVPAASAAPAAAQDATAGLPGEWLAGWRSARTLGLGGAYVASASDALGVLWNPAGLPLLDRNELRFESAQLYESTGLTAISFAVPGSRLPSLGVSMVSLRSGGFERTNDMNDALGEFSQGETAWLFTVAKGLSPRLSVGANFKLAQQSVEEFSGGGFGADLGATYSVTPELRVGASVLNLAGPSIRLQDTDEKWPSRIRAGAAYTALGGRALVTVDVDQSEGSGATLHGGSEYWMQRDFAVRLGWDGDRGTGGFSWRFAPQYQVDYGVADHPLGLSHRVGLAWRFGGFFAGANAEPAVFSPTGERAVTRISLAARTKAAPDDWTLEILDKNESVVRRFGGKGQPPAHVQWDGKDATGLPLADGHYRYRLTVRDAQARVLSSVVRALEIATSGPQGDVPVIPLEPVSGSEQP